MKLNVRVVLGALAVIGAAALVLPANVGAQKVLNPGTFSLQSTGGQVVVGGLGLDLTPQPLPQCSDGLDNDADTRADDLDFQCNAGPNGEPKSADDSELAPGFQPKVNLSITGTVNGAGQVSIPPSGVVFPPAYIVINVNGTWTVKAEVLATETATGSIDPLTGAVVLDVRARIKLSGNVGNQLASTCSIGTAANPIRLNLISGRKEAVPGGNGAITGSPYNSVTGNALLVDNSFNVPGATGCTAGIFDLNSTINSQVGIPSAVGKNAAVLAGKTVPALAKAISPVITSSVPLSGNEAPFVVSLSGASSTVAKAPASYSWQFSDGTTATGEYVDKTFAAGSQSVTLTVTDGDGDKSSTTSNFTVAPGTGTTTTTASTTTTTASTTTTTAPTTTTTASTTTTTAPTTTTTASTTTTTAPTTTTTASTTTTTAPTTTTTAPTTTTTTPTTTTTAPTTTTTASTTTTTAPTTTTTTIPQPSDDSVAVRLSGAVAYENGGTGNGDIAVRRDANGIVSATGFLDVDGTQGGAARVSVGIQRAWILPLWSGQISVRDQGAGVNVSTPVFGQISRGDTLTSARGTANWFLLGTFPNLLRPYSLSWSVVDAG
jgi:hypothetical protein